MDKIILALVDLVRQGKQIDNHIINRVIRDCGENDAHANQKFSKKRIVPYYLKHGNEYFGISKEDEKGLLKALQIKPRRTASGVATITVMTKPWKCGSACIYCPNDIRMPKSYLTDEPVCQRAEFVYFDPYLQIMSRLRALKQMGHKTDKIEVIILGGTWSDYPEDYQIWFVEELFRALNDSEFIEDNEARGKNEFEEVVDPNHPYKIINNSPIAEGRAKERQEYYENIGLTNDKEKLSNQIKDIQSKIFSGEINYNKAWDLTYNSPQTSAKNSENLTTKWLNASKIQKSTFEELEEQQKINETARHRVVGLVIETRPDTITKKNLTIIRHLGCTKVQIGIQSLQQNVLNNNHRRISVDKIAEAFSLLRLFGFKIHIHFMLNLYTSNPKADIDDYLKLVTDPKFLPDEVKLYPCMLVDGTELVKLYKTNDWIPYSEQELIDVLVEDTKNTPRYCRISRMIRDISAKDIMAGNKKSNLRQLVENKIKKAHQANQIQEIRFREIGTQEVDLSSLKMNEYEYQTSVAEEHFLEWVTPDDKIAGFLRLSLPLNSAFNNSEDVSTIQKQLDNEAMIREVHVYGKVQNLNNNSGGSQHHGLGKKLIARASEIAKNSGYKKINVISSIGTREYYRHLGFNSFTSNNLYQQKNL
ncbi:MAG: tRNA uridine(34) 5-carboxymethylaminomethyl modification radical SAM/GNAT enzyme Elp3 [Candidatus Ancillula sp.]|jgi:elongator complex protein 3|nr:tRNA uridine(34) 5-carboxymethylaminomethyl modification radical SAM/GNAT enzyme Elp3 [Candidatus Ancillula sp.]